MNFLTDRIGREITGWNPFPVNDVSVAYDLQSVPAETVTFATGAAGFSQVVALDKAPVMNALGDAVGSYWRNEKNLRATNEGRDDRAQVTAVTETATAATVTITDLDYDLEELFESTAGRYVVLIVDPSGGELYGWIKAIGETGSSYVIDVYNSSALSTQSWVGTLSSFTWAAGTRFYIYSYETSFAWVTGTVLTKEIEYKEGIPETQQLDGMSSGNYAIDYLRGRLLYKKATTGTSDTCTYTTRQQIVSASFSGTFPSIKDDAAFTIATDMVSPCGFLADETSTDLVDEGDAGIARMTLDRKQIMAGAFVDDAALAGGKYTLVVGARADETATDSVDEGDAGYLRMTLNRRLITAGQLLDDSALGIGTDYVTPIGGLADETATDSVDEGDVGAVRMTLTRKLFTAACQIHDAVASGYINVMGATARAAQQTAVAAADAAGLVTNLFGELVIAGYIWSTGKIGTTESDPLSTQYLNESLVDTTNVAATTHYYPGSTGASMDGYADLSLTGKFIDADGTLTLTLQVTNDEDTTSGDWNGAYFYDDELNATVNSKTVTNGTELFSLSCNNNNFRYYRWVVVASGATNTVILKGRKKTL